MNQYNKIVQKIHFIEFCIVLFVIFAIKNMWFMELGNDTGTDMDEGCDNGCYGLDGGDVDEFMDW